VVRKLFADTTPLRTPDFRRLWLAGIVTGVGGKRTIFAVPARFVAVNPKLRVCGAFRAVRIRAAGRVRPVGWGVGRRDGPAAAADHPLLRAGGRLGAAVAGGRIRAQTRLGGA